MLKKFSYSLVLFFCLLVAPSVKAEGQVDVDLSHTTDGGVHTIEVKLDTNGTKICSLYSKFGFDSNQLYVQSVELGNPAFQNVMEGSFDIAKINSDANIIANLRFPGCQTNNFVAMRFKVVARENRGTVTILGDNFSAMGGTDGAQGIALSNPNPSVSFSTTDDNSVAISTPVPSSSPSPTSATTDTNKEASLSTAETSKEKSSLDAPTLATVSYANNALLDSNKKRVKGVVFAGTAVVGSKIIVSIDGQELVDSIVTDASGNWSVAYQAWLKDGGHDLSMTAEKAGVKSDLSRTKFHLNSANRADVGLGLPVEAKKSFSINVKSWEWLKYSYFALFVLLLLGILWAINRYLKRVRIVENVPLNENLLDLVQKKPESEQ